MNRSQPNHIAAHTGIRGIAAIIVFTAHLQLHTWFAYHWLKVAYRFILWQPYAADLFFILSGFVICHVYSFRERLDWSSYFRARFARMYPLLFVTLFLLISLDAYSYIRYGIDSPNLNLTRILANVTLINGLYDHPVGNSINPPAWYVSVQVFLYIFIFPPLYYVFRQIRPRTMILVWVWIATCTILLMESHHFLTTTLIPHRWSFICRGIFGFAIGYGLRQVVYHCYGISAPRWADLASLLAIASAAAILATDVNNQLLIPCFSVLVLTTSWNGHRISSLFSNRLLTYLGERSYSIYLIHNMVIIFSHRLLLYPNIDDSGHYSLGVRVLTFGTIIAGTLVLSELSYRYLETPCRKWLLFRPKLQLDHKLNG